MTEDEKKARIAEVSVALQNECRTLNQGGGGDFWHKPVGGTGYVGLVLFGLGFFIWPLFIIWLLWLVWLLFKVGVRLVTREDKR